MYAKLFTLAALVSAVVAHPQGGVQTCSTSAVTCCNQVQTVTHPDVTQALQGGGLSLASVLAAVGSVTAQVGLDCTPISVIGVGGNSCSAQAVCCNNNNFNGVVAAGCNPINVNL